MLAHPEKRKGRAAFDSDERGIYLADTLCGNTKEFMQLGGRVLSIRYDEVLEPLTAALLSVVRSADRNTICLDLRGTIESTCAERYVERRDEFRVEDRLFPREPQWASATRAYSAAIMAKRGDNMGTCALKQRIQWDKHQTGRHLNFGKEVYEELQKCPSCHGGPETQKHILVECEHPEMVDARTAAMNRVGGALGRELRRDIEVARFLERYHNLVVNTADGYTLLTGMLSGEALEELQGYKVSLFLKWTSCGFTAALSNIARFTEIFAYRFTQSGPS